MREMRTEGLSIRAAMLIGFVVMLALWLFAWVQMSRQIVDAQERAAAAHARYNAAQETLANVRARVLMASVAFRDALRSGFGIACRAGAIRAAWRRSRVLPERYA